MSNLPAISGPALIKLLENDGWEIHRRVTHGVSLRKKVGDRTLVTVIPTKKDSLPRGTLGAILGPNQTDLGSDGLERLLRKSRTPRRKSPDAQ